MPNNLLSVKQVAFILQIHPLSVRRYIRDGKLKALKIGGNVRIDEESLNNFHKEIKLYSRENIILKNTKKLSAKQFDNSDPFLRLEGRGASLE